MKYSYFNIVVIGAGMFGCSAAKYLSMNEGKGTTRKDAHYF
jgi:glycine/D-amino acid oxidase-like deaminating enzyme